MNRTYLKHFMKREVEYWRKRLHIKPIDVTQDNNMWAWMCVGSYIGDNSKFYLHYNARKISRDNKPMSKNYLRYVIFHELAHLKKKAFRSILGKLLAEYIAEYWAVKWSRKYLPQKDFIAIIKEMKEVLNDKECYKKRPYYRKAFSKVYDDITRIKIKQ